MLPILSAGHLKHFHPSVDETVNHWSREINRIDSSFLRRSSLRFAPTFPHMKIGNLLPALATFVLPKILFTISYSILLMLTVLFRVCYSHSDPFIVPERSRRITWMLSDQKLQHHHPHPPRCWESMPKVLRVFWGRQRQSLRTSSFK